ncbi:MAG: DNA polymerase III subunit alpha [Proteobacteria bacterium]|nr:DNA polymerase III subunit alpha [Pseudomonadota bacterium]
MFTHLHTHSCYSLMRGASQLEALVVAARRHSMTHLALTDTNGFYGLPNFLETARKHGIEPIAGVQVTSRDGEAVLLARTPEAYPHLSELVSRRHLEETFSLTAALAENLPGVVVLSADLELLSQLQGRAELYVEIRPGSAGKAPLRFAREHQLPRVATNAVYFAEPDGYSLHRLLRAIDLNSTLADLPKDEMVQPGQWLKPTRQMAAHFPHCPEALAEAIHLARRCHTGWKFSGQIFPSYRDQKQDHFHLLRQRCLEGVNWRYGEMSPAVAERLEEELSLIQDKGFTDYFLVVADIIHKSPITCGRGSAAASLVSYLLGITHVDPVRHQLFFGRFLSAKRRDFPDIDVDFPWDERDEVLDFVKRTYGSERTAMVTNHVGFRSRAAVREVAKVYGIPPAEIKQVTKRLSFFGRPTKIQQRMIRHPKFQNVHLEPPWPEILQLASRLNGIPRHLSVHCGGTIIVPDKVSRYVPVQRAPKGVRIIQWEKDQAEAAGLVKIDLLGNRSLAVIRDALAAIRDNTGRNISYAQFNPLDDPRTQRLIARGETMGVFYVESPAMRQLQQMTGRGDYEHLVIHSSIIRPAANQYILEYVRRLKGAPYKSVHPLLDEALTETYGIMVYQEDVSQIAMKLAGFDAADADTLRKVLSKKSKEQLSDYRNRFYKGCRRRGVSSRVIDAVWEMIESFGGYSFCKPHSASYALVSFKSAYLKAHYPAEFMAAVISNGGGYYSTFAYISETRRLGLQVLGPDVNASDINYQGKDRALRVGLMQLKGMPQDVLETIINERSRNGPFRSLDAFCQRTAPEPAAARILVQSGTLDSIAGGLNRPQMLWRFYGEGRNKAVGDSFSLLPNGAVSVEWPQVRDYNHLTKLSHERETLGFILSVHPLRLFSQKIAASGRRIVPANQLHQHVGRRVTLAAWSITGKEVITRNGDPMEFISFEDETAIFETTFFPKAYQRFCQILDMNRAYLLTGRVEEQHGTVSLNVADVRRL